MFIALNGDEVAERYLDYINIETLKEGKVYWDNCDALGFEPIEDTVITKLEEQKKMLEEKYGDSFSKENGWAASIITPQKRGVPFQHILGKVGLKHMNPYYKFSCVPLHAGPKNLFYDIGKIDGAYDNLILKGQSNVGFTEPAQLTAFSLWTATSAFIYLNPVETDFFQLFFLRDQITYLAKKFYEIELNIQKEEKEGV